MDKKTTEADLVKRLARDPRIGRHAMRAFVHVQGDDPIIIENALKPGWDGEEGRKELLSAAKRFAESERTYEAMLSADSEQGLNVRSGKHDPNSGLLTESERKRGAATEVILAKVAGDIPRVRQLRSEVLGGQLLDEQTAIGLLHSPALALLSPAEMKELGAPIVGHESKVDAYPITGNTSNPTDPGPALFSVFIDPPGTTIIRELKPQDAVVGTLMLPSQNGRHVENCRVYRGSTLNEIRVVAELLAAWFIWPPEEAAMFILTGSPPPALPISSRAHVHGDEMLERGRITLEIEPWLPAETVARIYRAQQQSFVSRDIRALGRKLDVFLFVTERRRNGRRWTWRELVAEWDNTPGNKPYGGNARSFQRDYNSARKDLLFPYGEKLLRFYSRSRRAPWMW